MLSEQEKILSADSQAKQNHVFLVFLSLSPS